MGGTPRRGVLFEGPPGTGKTYMAKAMAREAGVPFLFVSSSAFQSMYYGQTNRKIRNYFSALRKTARKEGGAIGFIEEIDAIGASRSGMGVQYRPRRNFRGRERTVDSASVLRSADVSDAPRERLHRSCESVPSVKPTHFEASVWRREHPRSRRNQPRV